jgi:hypothetical protein
MRMLYNMDDELLWGFKSKQKRHLTFGTLTIFKRSLNKSSVLAETHIHLGRSENGLPQETHSIPLHAHYLVACIPILLLQSIFLNLSMSFYIPFHDFRIF